MERYHLLPEFDPDPQATLANKRLVLGTAGLRYYSAQRPLERMGRHSGDLVLGSHLHIGDRDPFESWKDHRDFAIDAVHVPRGGTMLDVGVSNGLFLRSVQARMGHSFIPYGIDINPLELTVARTLFTGREQNFREVDAFDLTRFGQIGLPPQFDTIYWAVWSSTDFDNPRMARLLELLVDSTSAGGQLLLAFYNQSQMIHIDQVQAMHFHEPGKLYRIDNPVGPGVVLEYWNR
jgi:hypothetical protein